MKKTELHQVHNLIVMSVPIPVAFCVMFATGPYLEGRESRDMSVEIVWPSVTSSVTSGLLKRARIPRFCPLNCEYRLLTTLPEGEGLYFRVLITRTLVYFLLFLFSILPDRV